MREADSVELFCAIAKLGKRVVVKMKAAKQKAARLVCFIAFKV
jgi:hypothetical protein